MVTTPGMCQVNGADGRLQKVRGDREQRGQKLSDGGRRWLLTYFECKPPAALGKNCLGHPSPLQTLLLPEARESEVLAIPLHEGL
jgi:hypothetical protein